MHLFKEKKWLLTLKKWTFCIFILVMIAISVSTFCIIAYISDNTKTNHRQVFERAVWSALQLQVQSYRFQNYLVALDSSDYPLNGSAFFEYDLLMSQVNLLRKGDIGSLIRNVEGGYTTRLLNIISSELELLSFNVSKIESGDLSYLDNLIERVQKIEDQTNEFTILINKGSHEFTTSQHHLFNNKLGYIQFLSIVLLGGLSILCFITIKGLSKLKKVIKSNQDFQANIQKARSDKASMVFFINQEIRSPVNAILSIANTLKNKQAVESPQELSRYIEESGHQLLQTIEMLSDLTLIDTHKMTLTPTIENLQDSIENILETIAPQMSRKNLQCVAYIDPILPNSISIDFVRMKEIIIALLQNAITYTPSGSISLQIRASTLPIPSITLPTSTHEARVLQIAVKDIGVGMPSQLQQHLRVIPSLPIKQKEPTLNTLGLSLTLCHKLVYLMKGEMHFSSTPQQGSEFWIDIPFCVPNLPPNLKYSAFQFNTKKHALLIETDTHLAKIISLQLTIFNIDTTLSIESTFHDDYDYDLVILGSTKQSESEKNEAMQQWDIKNTPILSYHTQTIENKNYSVIPLYFPLLQNQLEPILSKLFNSTHKAEGK